VAVYCSKDHQKQDWKLHKTQCSPYRICQSPTLGRYLEASRDIAAGDVILTDSPLLLGPKQVTMPVCLGCFSPVDGSYSCSQCGWPMCSSDCEMMSLHKPECQLSQSRSSPVQVKKFLQMNEMYECITPLRCLWLRDNEPQKWKDLMQMESHYEERKNTDIFEINQTNVAEFVQKYLFVKDFNDEEVHKICGIIDVNGFEIPGPNIVGLYGKACLLEHSCIPNTARAYDQQLNIIVRAAVPIKKGEHLTTTYSDPMWGTTNRQYHLRTTKYFKCICSRCQDPTELGTHLSSILCKSCSGNMILSPSPLNPEAYVCQDCGISTSMEEADFMLKQIGERLVVLKDAPLSVSEAFLRDTSKQLSENHYYRTDVKFAIAQMYGRKEEDIDELHKDLLDRKEQLCRDVLRLADLFSPGVTRLCGLLRFELGQCIRERYRRLPKKHKIQAPAKTLLQEAADLLKQASVVLLLESQMQDEYQLGLQAEDDLEEVNKLLAKCRI